MLISSGRRLCSTGTANSHSDLQQKDLSNRNTNGTAASIPAGVRSDLVMEKALFPGLRYPLPYPKAPSQ